MSKTPAILGVDIGGTKVELCYFTRSFRRLACATIPTREVVKHRTLTSTALVQTVRPYLKSGVAGIGLSIKGLVHNNRIRASSLASGTLRRDIVHELHKKLRLRVTVLNDVHAMSLAEQRFGAGRTAESFVLVNVGTGFGLGYMRQGTYLVGTNGYAGEVSHLGGVLSGKKLTALYHQNTGLSYTAEEIFLNLKHDKQARACVAALVSDLAHMFCLISAFYDPKLIVVTGGLTKSAGLFLPQAVARYHQLLPKTVLPAKVSLSWLPHAACLGAAIAATP